MDLTTHDLAIDDQTLYKVHSLIDFNPVNNTYLVKWDGDFEPSWEPVSNISNDLIDDFNLNIEIINHNSSIANPVSIVFPYLRISRGLLPNITSIDVQKLHIFNHAKRNQSLIAKVFIDTGISACNMQNLKSLNYMVNVLENNVFPDFINEKFHHLPKEVFCFDVSRFSRNTLQALQILDRLEKLHINVFFLTENVSYEHFSGKHVIRSFLSDAQLLSNRTSEKVKKSIQFKRANGLHVGSCAFGWKLINGVKVINIDEKKIILKIKMMFKKLKCFSKVADAMNNTSYTFRNKKFTPSNVKLCYFRDI